mmetsp:Transcript_71157/g.141092  ORF Transcript_71157/g.141092 Transcript_71157/m.141092 type:complete len:237 (-) Transcript_71157:529-1239(-)
MPTAASSSYYLSSRSSQHQATRAPSLSYSSLWASSLASTSQPLSLAMAHSAPSSAQMSSCLIQLNIQSRRRGVSSQSPCSQDTPYRLSWQSVRSQPSSHVSLIVSPRCASGGQRARIKTQHSPPSLILMAPWPTHAMYIQTMRMAAVSIPMAPPPSTSPPPSRRPRPGRRLRPACTAPSTLPTLPLTPHPTLRPMPRLWCTGCHRLWSVIPQGSPSLCSSSPSPQESHLFLTTSVS